MEFGFTEEQEMWRKMCMEFTEKEAGISLNSPFLEPSIDTKYIEEVLESCRLTQISKSFVDFSVWNVLVGRSDGTKLFLVDFPQSRCMFTPHLDLSKFRLSLRVVKEHPQFRYLRMSWWDVESMFDRFVSRYSEMTGTTLNADDLRMVDFMEREHVIRLRNILDSDTSGLRLTLERLYMNGFMHNLLNPRRNL